MSNPRIVWAPQPRQEIMMSRPEFEALYGGAAGGGKSDYLVAEALRQVQIPQYRAIIFRKTYPELEDIISRSHELYGSAFPRAKYNESKHAWRFPSGAMIYFGQMQYTKDKLKYQGRHFDFVGFDELTHFAKEEYMYLFSRVRSSAPGLRTYIRSTANPGGPGHPWVKARFVSIAKPETKIVQEVNITKPSGEVIKRTRDRIFIPSSVFDNKALLDNNPEYIASLAMLPEAERNALLYGDWDSFSGQVFSEWKNDPSNYESREWTHVIEPFKIPEGWLIGRSYDFGYTKPFSVGWYAVDYSGCVYRIRELYGCKEGQENVGLEVDPAEQARMIREVEETDPNLKGRKIAGMMDKSDLQEQTATMMDGEILTRRPVFDVKISAQKASPYSRIANNELAKELFGMGLFNPQLADQALAVVSMMDFDRREEVIKKISENGTMYQEIQQLQQILAQLAPMVA